MPPRPTPCPVPPPPCVRCRPSAPTAPCASCSCTGTASAWWGTTTCCTPCRATPVCASWTSSSDQTAATAPSRARSRPGPRPAALAYPSAVPARIGQPRTHTPARATVHTPVRGGLLEPCPTANLWTLHLSAARTENPPQPRIPDRSPLYRSLQLLWHLYQYPGTRSAPKTLTNCVTAEEKHTQGACADCATQFWLPSTRCLREGPQDDPVPET